VAAPTLAERMARVEARLEAIEAWLGELVQELRNERAHLEERVRALEVWTSKHNAIQQHQQQEARARISVLSVLIAAAGTGFGMAATLFGLLR
jgi:uncharacterized protein YlxW (UPF0749 family)